MTAYTEQQFKQAALKSGMDDFLVKPVFKQQMQTIVGRLNLC